MYNMQHLLYLLGMHQSDFFTPDNDTDTWA